MATELTGVRKASAKERKERGAEVVFTSTDGKLPFTAVLATSLGNNGAQALMCFPKTWTQLNSGGMGVLLP